MTTKIDEYVRIEAMKSNLMFALKQNGVVGLDLLTDDDIVKVIDTYDAVRTKAENIEDDEARLDYLMGIIVTELGMLATLIKKYEGDDEDGDA